MGTGWHGLGRRLTSAASWLGSCRRKSSGTRLCSTSFRKGPRSPTRSPPQPRRTRVPRSPTAEARTASLACVGGCSQGGAGVRPRRSALGGRDLGAGSGARQAELGPRAWAAAGWGLWGGRDLGRDGGGAGLTSSRSGRSLGPSSAVRSRTGGRGRSRSLRRAPSAALTRRVSPSPRAPRSVGSNVLLCRTCGGRGSWAAPRRPPARPAPRSPSSCSAPCGPGPAGPASALRAQGRSARRGAAPG